MINASSGGKPSAGKKATPPTGATPEANELAEYLRELTKDFSTRALGERFEHGRNQWSEYRRGTKLIPLWLLENVVKKLVKGPTQQAKLQQGRELLMVAEEAGARLQANKRPQGGEAELLIRLDDARKGQIQAQQMLMGVNQLVSMLLVMISSLHERCVRLEHERDQALTETTSSTAVAEIRNQLAETELRLAETERRLHRARHEREEAENLRVAAHRIGEEHRLALEEKHRQTTRSGTTTAMVDVAVEDLVPDEEEAPLWAYDSALEKVDAQLSAHQRVIDELRGQVGLSTVQEEQDPQVIRGIVVRADNADKPEDFAAKRPPAHSADSAAEDRARPSHSSSRLPRPAESRSLADTGNGVAVTIPDLGQVAVEATITRWLKSAGDRVEYDEPLLEISTDKVETEVRAPVAGVLLEGVADLDEEIAIGETVAYIRAEPDALAIRMPPFEGTGVAIRWLKTRGDRVAYREPLLEFLPNHITLPAPMEGTLTAVTVESAESAETGTILGYLQSHWLPPQRIPLSEDRQPEPSESPTPEPSGTLTPVLMPVLGKEVSEALVIRWLKTEGDRVVRDEPLLEVGTDKVDTEIPSPASGYLTGVRVMPDETVAINTLLAYIRAPDGFTVKMPVLSEYACEAVIKRWWPSTGEFVNSDAELVEVSTDAVDFTLRGEVGGILEILAGEGETVQFGEAVAVIYYW
ncbi:hypothetical protein OHB54_46255 (plasmid) [Streptomyces sp. NBC_01007]|nr:hypothetical protein OHB54_46255 [Streptomyces sp. NBC_01007]